LVGLVWWICIDFWNNDSLVAGKGAL